MTKPAAHETLAPSIRAMIDATNRGDSAAFLAAFADEAVLIDWGRTFTGRAEIARWNSDENIGTQNKLRVTSVARSGREVRVSVRVSGNGYNGEGTFAIEVEEKGIVRMVIS